MQVRHTSNALLRKKSNMTSSEVFIYRKLSDRNAHNLCVVHPTYALSPTSQLPGRHLPMS